MQIRTGLAGVLLLSFGFSALAQESPPNTYFPSIRDRQKYSEIVCFGTILKIQETNPSVRVEGAERSQWTAEARVDRVLKGNLDSKTIKFVYYSRGPDAGGGLGLPSANFQTGVRYVLFLRGREPTLAVAVPFYQMEITIALRPATVAMQMTGSDAILANELLFAVQSSPATTGSLASHYLEWVEELVGKKEAVPLVEVLLSSPSSLVRYQAAWFMSFRTSDSKVLKVLESIAQDPSVEQWARAGARDRLVDMRSRR